MTTANIRVEYSKDRMGNLIMTPVNKRLRAKIVKHLEEWGIENPSPSGFAQFEDDIGSQLERAGITVDELDDIDNGWIVTKLVDAWTWLHNIDYDGVHIEW